MATADDGLGYEEDVDTNSEGQPEDPSAIAKGLHDTARRIVEAERSGDDVTSDDAMAELMQGAQERIGNLRDVLDDDLGFLDTCFEEYASSEVAGSATGENGGEEAFVKQVRERYERVALGPMDHMAALARVHWGRRRLRTTMEK